jgi:hypothetical protein
MTIQITRPEIEALIQQRLHSGAFESVEDILFDALEIQGEREAWLQENKDAIDAKIDRGLAQLDRGESICGRYVAWPSRSRQGGVAQGLTQRIHPPQPRKSRKVPVRCIQHAPILNGQRGNLRIAHQRGSRLPFDQHPSQQRPMTLSG